MSINLRAYATRREMILSAAVAATSRLRAQSANDVIGAARDLMYQALELLSPHATGADVTRAVRFLRGALDQYPGFGDAHYYRYMCLRRLNQEPALQNNDMSAARRYESEALRDKRDPFVLAVPKLDDKLDRVGEKWALVVGISNFSRPNGEVRLPAAAKDAQDFADLLRDPNAGRFNHVKTLIDREATQRAIKTELNEIATAAKPEDIVLVFMATHGSAREDDIRGVSYLSTWDTDVQSKSDMFATALGMIDLSQIVSSRCEAQRTIVILDTCHSGAGAGKKALSAPEIDRLRDGAGRYVLSSCGDDQVAAEDKVRGHGYFTASLIETLRARKGCIPLRDLFAQVQRDVTDRVKRVEKITQVPVMKSSDNAPEIVLGAAPGSSGRSCTDVA